MITLIIFLALGAWIINIIHTRIRTKRIIYFNELNTIYDQMEMFVLKHKIEPTSHLISFLKNFKFLLVNKEFADIKIMLKMELMTTEKMWEDGKKNFDGVKKELDPELISLSDQFFVVYSKLITLSIYNFNFICFVFRVLLMTKYFAFKRSSAIKAGSIKRTITGLFNPENVIAYSFRSSKVAY